jgi:nicotinate-nucleotide pyrophosphorylase (carboxylating)
VAKEFPQIDWDNQLAAETQALVQLAVREDLDRLHDWTTVAIVDENALGRAHVVARQPGVIAGLPVADVVCREYDRRLTWTPLVEDGARVLRDQPLGVIEGPARSLLSAERVLLNFLGHLSGIASLTAQYVAALTGTKARLYDTRKTLPGWRRLEKYAVRVGGGQNHRTGLFQAVLIKDNHLAFAAEQAPGQAFGPAEAITRVRNFLAQLLSPEQQAAVVIEVEVDTLDQLDLVLPLMPDIVLLDNMPPVQLAAAVRRRDSVAPAVELEASGGVRLDTIRDIARSGVDRISVGGITHSAPWFDVGLDWG